MPVSKKAKTKAQKRQWRSIDLAYLAAFIDGEGTICIFSDRRCRASGSYLRVCAYNSHAGVIAWIAETFGGSSRIVKREGRADRKIQFIWEITGRRAAPLLSACLPYFKIKKEQALLYIAVAGTMRSGAHVPSNVVEFRRKASERVSALNKGHPYAEIQKSEYPRS